MIRVASASRGDIEVHAIEAYSSPDHLRDSTKGKATKAMREKSFRIVKKDR